MMYSRWFRGTFAHLPGIGCDNFYNLDGDQFFLSHCHADHMEGLDKLFLKFRQSNAVRINHRLYCSPISKAFLNNRYSLSEKAQRCVSALLPNEPHIIDVFDKRRSIMYKLRVTTIPSNHCPGSVMFLFESLSDDGNVSKRILYTGDFRFEDQSLESISSLHDANGQVLKLNEIYLDTTFCSTKYQFFPTRETALQAIWNIISSWIKKNGKYRAQRAKHVVLFHLPAQYGSEAILRDVHERSGGRWKVHVSQRKLLDYLCSQDLYGCTDSDPNKAQWIHACSWKGENNPTAEGLRTLPCQDGSFEVCRIRPSAMYFSRDRLPKSTDEPPIKIEGGNTYRVCYSCHSSLNELLDFVRYFQPKKVIPCDAPLEMKYEEVCQLLNSVLNSVESISPVPPSLRGQSSFGDFSPMSTGPSSDDETDAVRPASLYRKRKLEDDENSIHDRKRQQTCLIASMDSFDDVEETEAKTKRLLFHRSRCDQGARSMPSERKCSKTFDVEKGNRRASLPHNLKIPVITITAPSPTPDVDDPDYPEFFEVKPYIESRSSYMSTSVESGQGIDELRMVQDGPSFTEEGNISSGFSLAGSSCLQNNDDVFLQLGSKSFTCTVSLTDSEDDSMHQSTPDFDEILANAKTDRELMNCIKFAEQEKK